MDMTMKTRVASIVAAVLLASPLVMAQGNLVVNGSFNTDASGWTTNAASGYYEPLKGDPGGCFTLFASISQTINGLTPGASYLISGSYDVEGGGVGGTAPSLGVALDGVFAYEITPRDYAWHNFSFTYTPGNSSVVFDLTAEISGSADVYRVDNLSMQAVPEPGVLSLLGVGVGLIAWKQGSRAEGSAK